MLISPPQLLQTSAQPTAMIRLTVPTSQIRQVMGPTFHELLSTLRSLQITPVGPWTNFYHATPTDVFDFELSLPVASPIPPTGRVTNSALPAAKVAQTLYTGPYENLPAAWQQFEDWIRTRGHTPAPQLWEVYLTNPAQNPDPSTWQTQLTRILL